MSVGVAARRKFPVGAEIHADGGFHFRVWAPLRKTIDVVSETNAWPLRPEGNGYFSGVITTLRAGDRYRLRPDGGEQYPDPCSRFQPEGPHGPSELVDASAFAWTDGDWRGLELKGQIIYELHVGTFSREGTWLGALAHLPELARIGITVIELMPVADFSGDYGWGYDGVNWFAPTRLYGRPDEFRQFVNTAHSLGMGVILDVVYNHFGADGNYTGQFAPYYLSPTHKTDWGEAINYDGEGCAAVREYVISNAEYWIREYHLDGLRLDATQDVYDESPIHILKEVTAAARSAAGERRSIIIAENEPQHTNLVRDTASGGYQMDGLWNDDFHHSAMVAATGRRAAYYTDYRGEAQEFVSALKYGYLYQGQWYKWQGNRRGTPSFGVPASAFVTFLQNHDQIANSARGQRIHQLTSPGLLRTLTAITLLGPGTPMLFQGQEFGASAPFLYFADVGDCLRELVTKGRREFLCQFPSLSLPEMLQELPDPCAEETFRKCKLDHTERQTNSAIYALHSDLLRLRKTDPVLSRQDQFDGAVLAPNAFCFRIFNGQHGDRLLVVNLGPDLHLSSAPEPLLAPPPRSEWEILFSTEHPRYGGLGTLPPDTEDNWQLPAFSAIALKPTPSKEKR